MNILIVGLGSIAKKHIAAIRGLVPEASIFALRSSRYAEEIDGIVNLYSLENIGIGFDFAIISNPTSMHAETINELVGLKIPLFIEKPVFGELDHEDIIEKVNSAGVLNYVACNMRFLESVRFLHDYIKTHPEKRVNEVNVYCGSYLPDWRPGIDYRKCYSAIPELGGGVNIDLIHEIDYIYWIFGRPEESIRICRNVSSLGIRADDYANYVLMYPEFAAS
ncbi:MAG: Gfo/Idh/MocA family oxidoreductase, partial [Muribaculaceae bacterium]|nr:Gfo/Idh/MocA family oxidoreductase [Muribaculaceae bacterium]